MPSIDTRSDKPTADDAADGLHNWGLPDFDSELVWAPYRMACRLWLEAHHHALAVTEINRRLADEYLGMIRHNQDRAHEAMDKILHRLADGDGLPTGVGTLTTESITELYESAVMGLRELSNAMTEAQSRSIEALQKHAQATAEISRSEMERRTAA
jgi:hypothetical protein